MGVSPISTALAILKRAQAAGLVVRRDGDQLKLRAPKQPDAELLAELKAHKAEIIALLAAAVPSEGPIRIEYPLNRIAQKKPAPKEAKQKFVPLGHLLRGSPEGCWREVINGHWCHFVKPPSEAELEDERQWQLKRQADLKKEREN
jgi:hypothetical protein